MRAAFRFAGVQPSRVWFPALGAAMTCAVGCAQIVGIADTQVTSDGGIDATTSDGNVSVLEAGAETSRSMDGAGLDTDAATPTDARAEDGDAMLGDGGRALDANPGADASPIVDGGQPPTDASNDQRAPEAGAGGPTMVSVTSFSIDSTEVTVGQYKQFLAAKGGDTSGQPSVCSWNTSYYDTSIPMNPDTWPMTSLDWCDARAFCAWAGKRLCGKIGGGPIAIADVFTPGLSQWFLACGGPNGASHPNPTSVCNSYGGNRNLAPVATFPKCEGFYIGLFDMEGNAAEWVDSCEPGDAGPDADTCHLLGGSVIDNQSYCDERFDLPRNTTADPLGFRCCGG